MDRIQILRDQVVADYEQKTPGSRSLFERAAKALPGGASGNLRYFPPYPLYMSSGDGCRAVDVNGSTYVDSFLCNGPLLLGHRHPAVMAGIARIEEVGSLVVNPEIMIECAEKLQQVIPSAERVRFLNSGTEAVMTALRYARAYTRKTKVVKFYGHYHGQDDQLLVGVGTDRRPLGHGVPESSHDNTLTLPCDDIPAFEELLASRDDIAAVIIDPAMHGSGLWGVSREFLAALRDLTHEAAIVLIFDEVITGFRMGLSGAQGYHSITPDLTTLAKALSGGERLAAVVGSAEVMQVTDPLAPKQVARVFQSGTGNDATFALAAALGAIGEYERLAKASEFEALFARVEGLEVAIRTAFEARGIAIHVNRVCSMMQLFITDVEPKFENFVGVNTELQDLLHLAMINEGVILSLPTSDHMYFSFMHDHEAFGEIAAALDVVLEKYPFAEAFREQVQTR
jgi:glutamate-1-semialdehyde 2,1-aminomutase